MPSCMGRPRAAPAFGPFNVRPQKATSVATRAPRSPAGSRSNDRCRHLTGHHLRSLDTHPIPGAQVRRGRSGTCGPTARLGWRLAVHAKPNYRQPDVSEQGLSGGHFRALSSESKSDVPWNGGHSSRRSRLGLSSCRLPAGVGLLLVSNALPDHPRGEGTACHIRARVRSIHGPGTALGLRPNPSLKRSANGRPPGPRGRAVYHRPRGPGVLPSSPA